MTAPCQPACKIDRNSSICSITRKNDEDWKEGLRDLLVIIFEISTPRMRPLFRDELWRLGDWGNGSSALDWGSEPMKNTPFRSPALAGTRDVVFTYTCLQLIEKTNPRYRSSDRAEAPICFSRTTRVQHKSQDGEYRHVIFRSMPGSPILGK